MKLLLQSLTLLIILAYMAEIRISFRPFSISADRPWLVIGTILIMCGCICLKAQWYRDGLKRGAEIREEVREEIKKDFKNSI